MRTAVYWVAFKTIVTKEILRFVRIWVQTVLPPAITMALYFVIFGKLIGAQIGDMDGFRYIDFIVPGLILMSVISNSYANVVSSFYSSKFQHNVEELLIAPLPNFIILAGYVAGGVARGVVVGVVVTLVSLFFTDLDIHSYVVTFAVFEWELARGNSIDTARTAAVNMLVVGELVYLFNVRFFTATAFDRTLFTGNTVASAMALILIALQLLFTYAPTLQHVFQTTALDAASWALIVALGLAKFLVVEAEKWILRRNRIRSL